MPCPQPSIPVLDSNLPLPLAFTTQLPFSEEDLTTYPYLKNYPRYYCITKPLSSGGRAVAYLGYISDHEGNRLDGYKDVVIKLPNLDLRAFTVSQIRTHLTRIAEDSGSEWRHTRARLRTSKHACPIIDQHIFQIYYGDIPLFIAVTVQFRLDASAIDEHLVEIHQKPEKAPADDKDNKYEWFGMNNTTKWFGLAKGIAAAIADVHERRVVHGDIWPPNIFMVPEPDQDKYRAVLIDFGESFPLEPQGDPHSQRDHCYRAPERKNDQNIVTSKADVYSYGKLLLYLATGLEPILKPKIGYERRQMIRDLIIKEKKGLGIIARNPYILDIIVKCCSLDPIDRPSMREIVTALNSYVDIDSPVPTETEISESIGNLQQTWTIVKDQLELEGRTVSPFLKELIEQKINDIRQVIGGLANETVIVNDTREKVILAMISLFQRLQENDTYISLTSPQIWRSSALGLDGRYFSATVLATARGASIRRCFVFSVQELGETWVQSVIEKIRSDPDGSDAAKAFAKKLDELIKHYQANKSANNLADLPPGLQEDAQKQLTHVIAAYLEASQGLCQNKFDTAPYKMETTSSGLFLGLHPVAMISESNALKAAHPASVFYYSHANEEDRYLLMMTDCYARNDYETKSSRPELRGIMVFKSALGKPPFQRIQNMEQVFEQSFNVGGWLDTLYKAIR